MRRIAEKVGGVAGADTPLPQTIEEKAGLTGEFDIRDRLGQRFQKQHAPGTDKHQQYSRLAGREAKKKFREDWAKSEYANSVKGKK